MFRGYPFTIIAVAEILVSSYKSNFMVRGSVANNISVLFLGIEAVPIILTRDILKT